MNGQIKQLAPAASVMIACVLAMNSGSEARSRTRPQQSDTIVRATGRAVYPNGGTLVPEVTIGNLGGPVEQQFVSIYATALARDGSILVCDRGAPMGRGGGAAVRQFSRDGRFIRSFGRNGDGPGEWSTPVDVEVLPNGNVLVLSPRNARILVYAPDGTPLPQWRIPASGDHTSERLTTDSAGYSYLRVFRRLPNGGEAPQWIRYDDSGRMLDTMPLPFERASLEYELRATSSDGGERRAIVPYAPSVSWHLSRMGYFVTGYSSRYAVELLIPTGTSPIWRAGMPVISIRRSIAPATVADAERSALRRSIEESMRGVDPRWSWNGPDIPRTKPAFRYISTGNDGNIWVMRSMPSEQRPASASGRGSAGNADRFVEPTVYDVFEPSGGYLGEVRLKEGEFLAEMRGSDVWLQTRDADGVQRLVRTRLVWR